MPSGVKKFQEYLSHQKTDTQAIDLSRVETWVEAFNRAVQIGWFTTGDFVTDAPAKPTAPLTGRDREKAEHDQYLRDLRAEIGDAKFEQMYGRNGQSPLAPPKASPIGAPPGISVKLKLGDKAPDFALPNWDGKLVVLSEFTQRSHVVLVFYRGFW